MSKNFTLSLLFFYLICNAQLKNGIVEYGIVAHMNKPDIEISFISEMINKTTKCDTLVNYTLKFNAKSSNFSANSAILEGFKNVDEFNSSLAVKSKYFVSPSDSIYKYYENSGSIGEYTLENERKAKWTLTQETKMIGGYLCLKATSPHYNGESWSDNKKFEVTAWYTPKIPAPFGPNGHYGLPGLILELQTIMSTIYVKNISINILPDLFIDDLSNYKLITVGQRNMLEQRNMSPEMREFIEDSIREKKEAADKLKTK